MPEILVAYASTHGHTARIARRIAGVLERDPGVRVELRDLQMTPRPDPRDYDVVVAGGSVHMGRHQAELADWACRHARLLNHRPSAFFSVGLALAEGTDEARAAAQDRIDEFAEDTGWFPDKVVAFAGALQYREYSAPLRLWMRLLMARGHHPTDITGDVDLTDWDAVETFALGVAAMTPQGAPA